MILLPNTVLISKRAASVVKLTTGAAAPTIWESSITKVYREKSMLWTIII